jgi:hypothetical protein
LRRDLAELERISRRIMFQTSPHPARRKLWGCKTLSVNWLSSLRLHPSGVRRSGGERSEPSAAEPRRGGGAPRAKNWSRAGQDGFLLGCRQTHPTQNHNDPPKQV